MVAHSGQPSPNSQDTINISPNAVHSELHWGCCYVVATTPPIPWTEMGEFCCHNTTTFMGKGWPLCASITLEWKL